MAKLLNLESGKPEIQFTRKELDLIVLPYIENLRKEFEEKFNKISEIAESVKFLLEENTKIRTELRSFDMNKVNENQKKINILLDSLSKDFKIVVQ